MLTVIIERKNIERWQNHISQIQEEKDDEEEKEKDDEEEALECVQQVTRE